MKGRLKKENGIVFWCVEGSKPQPARLVWACPLSCRGGAVSILRAEKKVELAFLESLNELDAESRKIATEALNFGLVLPRILAINEIFPRLGNYYWDVDTDLGPRRFVMNSPENHTVRPADDTVIVKDVSGNCYEIFPVSGLSDNSLKELDRVL